MKTVFITGANRGLGLEFSRQYLAAGNRVIATARNPEDSEGLQALKKEYGEHLSLYPLDVTDANSRAAVSDAVGDRVIHLLINNAGYYGANNPLGKLDEADWSKVFHVNCIGPVKMVALLRSNLGNAGSATVAMLSSKMGSMGDNTSGGSYVYRSSKAALNAATKSLAIDLAEEQIKVVALHPGWVLTDMGGPNALIDVAISVNGMRKVIEGLQTKQSGDFIAYDGTLVPW
ncbi:MAG: short-chain dehydrogenase [Pseudomonadales bacterium]|jgi:NAD(P)-dependent dehydrogenase (short-subunit alcohol dehydrogenase family)|nr:short-chain dehydrogenase [Pseudomonadales bacterium]MEC8810788.1 SDR family oxidoreductase [Pseudomonadota bacterium]TNC85872.1 MAG: short-chain dehydrogenase [Alcanivorax sp.]HAG94931.1 short-chain dehydrogenase [Gammaproteobacteria bacterium]MAQ22892.1 short-chain dehydrogenase [Pseudomonadales bacterium]|tara:strand:+ start:1851 stop:2543 length:693 start_codon:yes stop_codon:yes gene_type:complete